MKRISLSLVAAATAVVALPAMVAAQAPVAATPAPAAVVAPVVFAAPTTGPVAPISPATNTMIQSNIALVGGINAMSYVPHKYADKSFASFQWAGGSPGSAEFWAAFDTWATSFRGNAANGDLAGYWLTPDLGLGAVLSLRRHRRVLDVTDSLFGGELHGVETVDSVVAPDGLELLASMPFGDMNLYGNVHARSLGSWDSTVEVEFDGPTNDTSFDHYFSSRNFRAGFTVGARTYATPNGSAWQAQFTYDFEHRRASGMDEATYTHRLRLNGRWGQRKDIDGYAIAYGANPDFNYADSKNDPDIQASLVLPPNFAVEIPLFQYWTLKGGATLPIVFSYEDTLASDDEGSVMALRTDSPTGNVGLRYARSRWAAEAVISSAFLTNGPYFLTGSSTGYTTTNTPIAQFALIANFD